jgi:hypothetical protein
LYFGSVRCAFRAESRLNEPASLVHLICRGAARLAKSSTASAAHNSEGTNLNQNQPQSGASQKIDAEHFCGFPTANANSSSTSTYVPELNIRGRTRG